ncbi:MAG: M23 family metallopeptidase [Rhodothermales bacterium]
MLAAPSVAAEDSATAFDHSGDVLRLVLPTSNRALLDADGPGFYQYTDRYFEGRRTRPWQGGRYGFVRNQQRSKDGEIIFTRFHEGVDVRPLFRDNDGEPRDTVRSIDRGTVVYVNRDENRSSYGRYVVIEHWWSGSPFYSLYAHLSEVRVRNDDVLEQGQEIGRIGFTGRGINKRRAHLHFEINILLNDDFGRWLAHHAAHVRNHHGNFNGQNLAGLNVAALYERLQDDPTLTIRDFIAGEEVFYAVSVPPSHFPGFLHRYPWMLESENTALSGERGWEIEFTQSGFPLRVRPAHSVVQDAAVSMVRESAHSYNRLTIGRLEGAREVARLTERGRQYVSLVVDSPPSEYSRPNAGK